MKVIGLDLDGTLAQFTGYKGHEVVGDPYINTKHFLQYLKKEGWTTCIWTCRSTETAERWVHKHRFKHLIDYVNDSPYPSQSAKLTFDVYLGDEAVRYNGNFFEILDKLEKPRHWGSDNIPGKHE
tara:strand:- start:458 stop:832 length:375 start_codon:yes stop_codon:yes gene_type:complete